jgi:hypothetical protein
MTYATYHVVRGFAVELEHVIAGAQQEADTCANKEGGPDNVVHVVVLVHLKPCRGERWPFALVLL